MNKDVSSILDLIDQLSESAVTPVDVKHGLNAQQRAVPQLPAQARAKKIKVLAAKKDPRHPFAGYMVGSNESVEPDDELDEADFNPGRRGFLKKAGAVAATAAMPKGLAGAAVNAIAPAASWASTLSAPFASLTAIDLDDIINLLMSQESKNPSYVNNAAYDLYDLETIKKIAEDASLNSWGNSWFVNGNAAQALLEAIDICEKKGMDDEDIIDHIFIVTKKQYMKELKELSPEEVAKVKSQSLNPDSKSEPAASPATGTSSLARAAGTQIGRTMKNIGKATANTVLNQPTAAPAALPAPTVSPGMQIPKQTSRVAASPFSDDHNELDQFVKEEFNREIDEEVTERQISVRRLADVIINEILRNKDALHTYGQDKILRAASSVASEWVDRKFSKEHLPVMVKTAMDKISSSQLDEFDASGFSERYTMYCDNDLFGRYEGVDDAVADAQQMMSDDYRMKGCFWVLKDISGETVWSQEPGDIIDAARQQNKIRFIDPNKDLEEDRDQPVNQGWNDFTVDGYRYEPWEEEEFDRENKKIHHSVRTPAGEVVSVDWDPYEYMEPGDLKSWIDLGMPTRQHAGTIGPLRADHLDKLAAQKKTVDETSFADAGEVVGGVVGGPAAFALARGRGGKKTYAAGSVAGSAIGNAAGRWIDNKIAPAAGVDQHGPGPMAKRYTKPIDESPETLYFFDVAKTTGSYTDQQLRALGLQQTQSGKWYYKPIGNNTQAVDSIAQRLNVQPKPWTPVREGNPAADWPIFGESKDLAEGAKVDRMVKHIASSEKAAGKSAKDAENIAWATANKRGMLDNQNKKKVSEETKISADIRAKNRAVVKKIQGKEVKEDITQEDVVSKLKAKLGDYLSDLGQQIKKDPALKDKLAAKPRDTMGPAVKTVTTDSGETISIHGNEDDGFRISIKNKPASAEFKTVDEAVLACTMFNARRKNPRINTDYVDEA